MMNVYRKNVAFGIIEFKCKASVNRLIMAVMGDMKVILSTGLFGVDQVCTTFFFFFSLKIVLFI